MLIEVSLDEITTEHPARFQVIVQAYAALLEKGRELKPILCYRRDGKIVVADGHHRFFAYKLAQRQTIMAFVCYPPAGK